MGEKEDLVEVAKKHLARSKRKLKATKLLYEQRFFDDAISRAYYSAYHTVHAYHNIRYCKKSDMKNL